MVDEILTATVQKINSRADADNVQVGSTMAYCALIVIEAFIVVSNTDVKISDFLRDFLLVGIGAYFTVANNSRIAAWYLLIASIVSFFVFFGITQLINVELPSLVVTTIGKVFCSIRIVESTIKINKNAFEV
jgi:hypothetical protein